MNKHDAIKKKADWMAYCLEIGFIQKDQLDELSLLWDGFRDENGELRKTPLAHDQFSPSNVDALKEELENLFHAVHIPKIGRLDPDFCEQIAQEVLKLFGSTLSSMSTVCRKWVKASERLPDVLPENETSTRFIVDDRNEEGYGKVWLMTYHDLKDLTHFNKTVKWLDESTPCLCALEKETMQASINWASKIMDEQKLLCARYKEALEEIRAGSLTGQLTRPYINQLCTEALK